MYHLFLKAVCVRELAAAQVPQSGGSFQRGAAEGGHLISPVQIRWCVCLHVCVCVIVFFLYIADGENVSIETTGLKPTEIIDKIEEHFSIQEEMEHKHTHTIQT